MNATRITCLLFTSVSLACSIAFAADMGTGFSYQGRLENPPGTAVDDTCDFRVGLWDAATLGNQVGTSPQTKLAVAVESGIFTLGSPTTTALDFGVGAIDGQARWLEIEVKCTGDAGFVLLSPRVEVTPAPHALALPGLYTTQNATSPNVIGGYRGNSVVPGVVGATISGGGALDDGAGNSLANTVTDWFSTIGGGAGNQAGDGDITINNQNGATVGGGFYNIASADSSVVSGGAENKARAQWSTVPGGIGNDAGGAYSFAAGRRAIVRDAAMSGLSYGDRGTFVWADSQDADFVSTGPNQFLIRAENGVGIGTNDPQARLHVVGDAKISGAATIGAPTTINNHAYFLNNASGPFVAIGAANYQADEALSIFSQDALAITGFQPFMTLYDTNAANARARIANAGGNFSFFPESFIGGNAAMVLTNSTGRLGIGATTPGMSLEVAAPSYYAKPTMGVADGSTGWAYLLADTTHHSLIWNSGTDMRFGSETSRGSGYAERMRITGSGLVGIGDFTPDVALDVVGDINYTGVIVDVSDERLKSDIQPLECALEKVARLRGISFTMKGSIDPREVGLIAQDVQQVLPEAVRVVDNENGYLGVSYPSVIPLLVEAIKEQDNAIAAKNCEIESLGSEISNLKSEIDELKSLVKALADRHNNGEGQ